MPRHKRPLLLPGLGLALLLSSAPASAAGDVPRPKAASYPGIIDLEVDASNVTQRIYHVRERIPALAGRITLLHPEWQRGAHAPNSRALSQFAGLVLTVQGRRIEWQRDPLNVYAFHAQLPPGTTSLDAEFDFLSPTEASQGPVVATPDLLAIHWEQVLLYPAGFRAAGISLRPSVRMPQGWQTASALKSTTQNDREVHYQPIDLEQLIDSPVYAGRHFRRIELAAGTDVPVFLDLFADSDAQLEGSVAQIEAHRKLVSQAHKLFGSHHYDHYDFLVAISDTFGFAGVEHQQSGENGVRGSYFADWDKQQAWRSSLISHEYTHSWDGKFLRPAGQITGNFNEPMDDSLLWVYEGGTSYWGQVLGARSGLVEAAQMRDALASSAALYDHRAGRRWRSLGDTTYEPVITRRTAQGWQSWQRAEDYYAEGELIWFDADTLIRERSGGAKSLDDFARAFFGVRGNEHVPPQPYTFDTVVRTLNTLLPYDWTTFLRQRVDGHGPGAPLDGIKRAGWELVYTAIPSDYSRDADAYRGVSDFQYSLGLVVGAESRIVSVNWDGPAFKAGLSTGYTLMAVDGRAYKPEVLKAALMAAQKSAEPIELILRKDDRFTVVRLDYHDGLKYPHLKRVEGTPDLLEKIFTPL